VDVSWAASTDNVAVTGYTIRRDGTVLTTTSATSFSDTTVSGSTTYSYTVDAFDAANNHSAQSAAGAVTTPAAGDTTAPSIPQGVSASASSSSQVDVSWSASTDDVGVTGYTVRRNGTVLGTTSSTSYTDTTVAGSTTYSYTVDAFDAANNHSAQSAAASVTTPATPDGSAPSTPQGVTATASSATQVNVSWLPSTDNVGVTGYTVRRDGTVLGTTTSATSFSDTTVSASTTYSYTVDAFDAAGNHSPESNAAGVTTPAPSSGIAMRAASFAATTATTLVIPVPAGTQAGDVMLAVVADRGQPNVVAPSGWSNVRKDQNSTTMGQWIFVKVAGSAEPASYTFTLSASQAAAGGILSYTGVNTSSPIDTSGGQSNASSMAVTAPSITTSVPNALVVGFFGIASAATITAPAGMSERGEQASTAGSFKVDSEVADALQSAAGASGSKIAAATGSSANIGQLVALRPA
jgi:chitodextrinase